MEDALKNDVAPGRWMWCVINNMRIFNDKPEYMLELFKKFHKITDHKYLSPFENVIDTVETYFNNNKRFPDMDWLKLNFKGIRTIKISDDPFSMQIYDSLLKYIDQEILRDKINNLLIATDTPQTEDFKGLADEMSRFASNTEDIPQRTKDSLLALYDNYSATFNGVKTYIKAIDDAIGVLGHKSLSVFAAPTGHGKSTFAFSVAYYNALAGHCVDYLSFEVPETDAWFNFVSMESYRSEHPLPSSKMKRSSLSEEEKEYFGEHMRNLLGRIKESNGYLNVIDQTTISGVSTYTDLCSRLERIAEIRGRKADLIIVDNIDNFQTLRSSDRDEVARINNYIVNLDAFVKKYYNNSGVAMLLLSQVNRPAMAKLYKAANEAGKGSTHIDVTCVQKYNALYEKATCVLLGFADEAARSSGIMRVHPVKVRNHGAPTKPIQIKVDYEYSKVIGDFTAEKAFKSQEEYVEVMNKAISAMDEAEIDAILSDS